MFLSRLPVLTIICFFILHYHNLFTSASNFPTPYPPVDSTAIYRCGDFDINLAPSQVSTSTTSKLRKPVKVFGPKNTTASYVIIVITLLNIIVHKLRQLHEEEFGQKNIQSSPSLEHQCRRFSFGEIQLATHNFDDALVLGKGGFGKVYRGLIDGGTNTVAVKRLNSNSKQGAPEFWTEIELLSKFRHSHLVSLIGYCNDDHEKIIVYEYMPHGNLSDHLYKKDRNGTTTISHPLSWEQRLKICIGAGRGLDYLHTGIGVQHRVIHRDVKSSNILLGEHWEAKISDFGLSKIGPANQSCTHVSTHVKGTFGYLDPEYFLTRRLTRKSDVYAFGVVLFEVLCGRPAMDLRVDEDQQALARCAQRCIKEGRLDQIIDPSLRGQISRDCLKVFADIANKCLLNDPDKRPTMVDVVAILEFALASQESKESSSIDFEFLINTGMVIEDNEQDSESSTEDNEVSVGDNNRHQNNPVNEIMAVGNTSGLAGQSGSGMLTRITRKMFKAIAIKTKGKNIWRKKKDQGTSNSTGPSRLKSISYRGRLSTKTTKSKSLQRQFYLPEIEAATNFFDAGHILAYGRRSMVFKGYIGRTEVAVKELTLTSHKSGYDSFCNEIILPRINHLHVLPLLGFCSDDDDKLFLVSEYMSNGSLHDHLSSNINNAIPLSWNRRLKICIGVAKGLNYLHTVIPEQAIIHGKLKPSKILLDENYIPKVSGFELSKLGTSVHNSDTIRHSQELISAFDFRERCAYMDPEYMMSGRLTEKSDVYSMGVVLLQVLFVWRHVIMGLVNMGEYQVHLSTWVKTNIRESTTHQFIDPYLVGKIDPECFTEFVNIALNCLMDEERERPLMEQVVERLEFALQLQTVHSDVDIGRSVPSFDFESMSFAR